MLSDVKIGKHFFRRLSLSNKNALRTINQFGIILGLLQGAKGEEQDIFVWKMVGGMKCLGQVKIESIRKSRKDICFIPVKGQEETVRDIISGQSEIDIYIPGSALVFRCKLKQIDRFQRYYLEIPSFVAQVERRKSYRLDCYDEGEFKLNFSKSVFTLRTVTQSFQKQCFDISSGGMSFLISKAELKFFEIGNEISYISVSAGNWSTNVDAQVTAIKEIAPDEFNNLPYKVFRVSCKFSRIDEVSKKYLDKIIFEKIKDDLRVINK